MSNKPIDFSAKLKDYLSGLIKQRLKQIQSTA